MKLWIDDWREPPDDTWVWVTNSDQAVAKLMSGDVVEVSFDNDLGLSSLEGWRILDWLELEIENGNVPMPTEMRVHSYNPVACDRMKATIARIRGTG